MQYKSKNFVRGQNTSAPKTHVLSHKSPIDFLQFTTKLQYVHSQIPYIYRRFQDSFSM